VLTFIRRSRAFAIVALLVITGSVPLSVSAFVHDTGDDIDASPQLVLHDHNAHRIGAAHGEAAPESQHCAVCHWLQSLHSAFSTTASPVPSLDAHRLASLSFSLVSIAAAISLAARAPPAA
jgi:hypothetical protein